MKQATAILLAASALAGCDFAPVYSRPDQGPPPAAFKEATPPDVGQWAEAQPADTLPRGAWWHMFNNPTLDALEAKVADANQDLKAAFARFEQARDEVTIESAALYPIVSGNASGTRQRLSRTTANQRPANLYNDFGANLDLNYEVDVWGRIHNTIVSAKAQAQASEGDLAALDLTTHAELANDYFTLEGDDAQIDILDRTVTAYQKAYELTLQRFNGGVAAEGDVDQAKTQLENARTQLADTRLRRAELEHAIAILTGQPPAGFSLPPSPLTAAPPVITADLPGTLLQRRPDIAAAERRVAAANAEIGVARAAFYPIVSLSAMGGFESELPQHVFNLPSRLWSLGSNATMPVFDAGQRNAAEDQAIHAYDEAADNYRQSVLSAFRDVEDNLAAQHQLGIEGVTRAAATEAADRALKQAQLRTRVGS